VSSQASAQSHSNKAYNLPLVHAVYPPVPSRRAVLWYTSRVGGSLLRQDTTLLASESKDVNFIPILSHDCLLSDNLSHFITNTVPRPKTVRRGGFSFFFFFQLAPLYILSTGTFPSLVLLVVVYWHERREQYLVSLLFRRGALVLVVVGIRCKARRIS
jgi:hypothetical protein